MSHHVTSCHYANWKKKHICTLHVSDHLHVCCSCMKSETTYQRERERGRENEGLHIHVILKAERMVLFFFLTGSPHPRLINERRTTLVVARGFSVDLNCQLNDTLALVSLQQQETTGKPHKIRTVDGVKLTQSGQIFTINDFQDSDRGRYYCKVNEFVLRIDKLYPVTYKQPGKQCFCWMTFLW